MRCGDPRRTAPDGSILGAANGPCRASTSRSRCRSRLGARRAAPDSRSRSSKRARSPSPVDHLAGGQRLLQPTRHNGAEHVDGDGYVVAAFRHRTSRAGDPQLHWHVLVANTARGPTAVAHARRHSHLPGAAHRRLLFEAEMRHELTNRLGVQWRPARNGISEIDGAPAAVLRHFSKRRSQIEDRLAIKGYSSGRAAQVARSAPATARQTRSRIRPCASGGNARPSRSASTRRLRSTARPSPTRPRARRRDTSRAEPEGLTHKQSTFTRLDALRDLASEPSTSNDRRGRAGHLSAARRPGAVDLGVDTNGSEDVELRSGRPIGTVTRRYSTRELLRWSNGSSTSLCGATRHSPATPALGHEARARHQTRIVR